MKSKMLFGTNGRGMLTLEGGFDMARFISHILMTIALALGTVPTAARAETTATPSEIAEVTAQRAVADLVSMHVVDMRLPASQPLHAAGAPRALPFLTQVSPDEYKRIKELAPFNSFAPRIGIPVRPFESTTPITGTRTPSPSIRFDGMSDSGAICPFFVPLGFPGCQPPDMALAVSPSFVVQAVNTSVAVYDTAGHIQQNWPKNFRDFFSIPNPGPCSPNNPFTSDPRAIYDPIDQRFWVVALEVEGAFGLNNCSLVSRYWIAVSQTSDPTGNWNVFAYDMTLGTNNVADFTMIGLDQHAFYFSANMFGSAGVGSYKYPEVFSVSKTALESGFQGAAFGFVNPMVNQKVLFTIQLSRGALPRPSFLSSRSSVVASPNAQASWSLPWPMAALRKCRSPE